MKASLTILTVLVMMLISPFHYSEPGFNGTAPGCGGSGCHTSQAGIVSVTAIGNLQVRVTLTGATGNVAGEIVDAGGNVVAVMNSTSTNPFILTAPSAGPYTVNAGYKNPSRRWDSKLVDVTLPVELVSFTVKVNKSNVSLKWNTATEINNLGFDIERLTSGSTWKKIGFIPGAGNSSSLKNYEYLDINPSPGKYSYRLKQIDMDGSFNYSPSFEVVIENPKEFELMQNYPNPFNPNTKISWQSPVSSRQMLKIYDVIGNEVATLVNEFKPAGKHELEFDASNFKSGVYFYKLEVGSFVETKKMILLR
jgi:hypothetical protein